MQKIQRKFTAFFILAALIIVVGGFCAGSAMAAPPALQGRMIDMQGCAHSGTQTVARQNMPMHSAVMPCCIDRHDNSGTTLPTVSQDRIKFSQSFVVTPVTAVQTAPQQKTFSSSLAPPPEPDILSSVVRLE